MTQTNPQEPSDQKPKLNEESELKTDPKHSSPDTSATTGDIPNFGWSNYAERVNGRFAMIGFTAVILIEAISHTSFLSWAGLVP